MREGEPAGVTSPGLLSRFSPCCVPDGEKVRTRSQTPVAFSCRSISKSPPVPTSKTKPRISPL